MAPPTFTTIEIRSSDQFLAKGWASRAAMHGNACADTAAGQTAGKNRRARIALRGWVLLNSIPGTLL
eukprot:4292145-Alexandrium_andersonii.AAC.1